MGRCGNDLAGAAQTVGRLHLGLARTRSGEQIVSE